MGSDRSVYTGSLILESRNFLTDDTFEIGFSRPSGFIFRPGQRVQLFHLNLIREYSLISCPSDNQLSFCVRRVSGGRFSHLLETVPLQTAVSFSGPMGHFIFRPSLFSPVFVATGTGIAPFVSMARAGASGFTILHGIRENKESYYSNLFQSVATKYVRCISHPDGAQSTSSGYFHGWVTDYLATHLGDGRYDFYLSGRREMIRDAVHIIDNRFQGSRVFSEIFY
jgi:benzoate/toluate 1,2-dioxygenase reductase component